MKRVAKLTCPECGSGESGTSQHRQRHLLADMKDGEPVLFCGKCNQRFKFYVGEKFFHMGKQRGKTEQARNDLSRMLAKTTF